MNPDLGQSARRLFGQVLEIPPDRRATWLDHRCGDDSELRAAVERLLWADAQAGDFLDEPIPGSPALARLADADADDFHPPARIGPYDVKEKIGQGGMGVVFRAERDDEAFARQVAIKLILQAAISERARRRMKIERQILASLDHPWIGRIFDGGTTDAGIPYLVMEWIDGEPIDRYCQQRLLSQKQRIELFRKVCDAVHCSHQNLVVHCDLKPNNILVTAEGEPKLLDFGIAKLLAQSLDSEPVTVGSRPLTPEYASPEQLRGETLSTASDVYSLGILLHKLLTGRRPKIPGLGGSGLGGSELGTSTAGQSDTEAADRLRGDLNHIVLKALRPQAADRFGSAQQLSEDLGRYLDGFPVLARRGSLRYRAQKFLRRHRLGVVVAALFVLALGTFAGGMAAMAGRLADERAKLQEVVGFFRLFFERAGPWVSQGQNLTLRQAVDQNARWIEQGLEDQPEAKVEIAAVLGDIYLQLGQPDQAMEWSRRAFDLQLRLNGDSGVESALGRVRLAAALRELERFDEAEQQLLQAFQRLDAQGSVEPGRRLIALNSLVTLYCYQGRYQEAVEPSRQALDLISSITLDKSPATAARPVSEIAAETMVATANRGLVLRKLGNDTEARHWYEQALERYRQTLGDTHPDIANLWLNLSLIERDLGDLQASRESLLEADGQWQRMFGDHHYGRIRPLVGLAKLAEQQHRIDEALNLYHRSLEVAMASEAPAGFVLRPAVSMAELALENDRCSEVAEATTRVLKSLKEVAGESPRYARLREIQEQCQAL